MRELDLHKAKTADTSKQKNDAKNAKPKSVLEAFEYIVELAEDDEVCVEWTCGTALWRFLRCCAIIVCHDLGLDRPVVDLLVAALVEQGDDLPPRLQQRLLVHPLG